MLEKEKPLILISNDDGYNAPGLNVLIETAREFGEVLVIAPSDAQSGMSHAITIKQPLRLNKLAEEPGCTIYKCSGTPADCVKLALDKIVTRKPDLVLSGINHGSNTSASVFYSGTLAIAVEGALNRIPSIGFSLTDLSWDANFSIAVKYIRQLIKVVLENGIPKEKCFNVNIPAIPEDQIKGFKVCRMTKGVWVEEFVHRKDPGNKDYYWLTGNFHNYEEMAEDTDEWAVKQGYVAVVPLHLDFTCHETIDQLKDWDLNVK